MADVSAIPASIPGWQVSSNVGGSETMQLASLLDKVQSNFNLAVKFDKQYPGLLASRQGQLKADLATASMQLDSLAASNPSLNLTPQRQRLAQLQSAIEQGSVSVMTPATPNYANTIGSPPTNLADQLGQGNKSSFQLVPQLANTPIPNPAGTIRIPQGTTPALAPVSTQLDVSKLVGWTTDATTSGLKGPASNNAKAFGTESAAVTALQTAIDRAGAFDHKGKDAAYQTVDGKMGNQTFTKYTSIRDEAVKALTDANATSIPTFASDKTVGKADVNLFASYAKLVNDGKIKPSERMQKFFGATPAPVSTTPAGANGAVSTAATGAAATSTQSSVTDQVVSKMTTAQKEWVAPLIAATLRDYDDPEKTLATTLAAMANDPRFSIKTAGFGGVKFAANNGTAVFAIGPTSTAPEIAAALGDPQKFTNGATTTVATAGRRIGQAQLDSMFAGPSSDPGARDQAKKLLYTATHGSSDVPDPTANQANGILAQWAASGLGLVFVRAQPAKGETSTSGVTTIPQSNGNVVVAMATDASAKNMADALIKLGPPTASNQAVVSSATLIDASGRISSAAMNKLTMGIQDPALRAKASVAFAAASAKPEVQKILASWLQSGPLTVEVGRTTEGGTLGDGKEMKGILRIGPDVNEAKIAYAIEGLGAAPTA